MTAGSLDTQPLRRLRIAELVVVGLAAVLLAIFGYLIGGLVRGSDMPYYIDIGLRGVADPFILYRYTHVYALRVLALIAGSSLAGMKLYSGLAMGLTVVLSYLIARNLTEESSPLNGAAGVLLLLSLPLPVNLLLAPHVDVTLMLVLLAFLTLYLAFVRRRAGPRWLLIGMGLLFVLALRTKEVALVLAVLVPGLGLTPDEEFSWPALRERMRDFLIGVVAGLLLFVIANQIFLATPLFGLRPADVLTHIDLWSANIRSRDLLASTVPELVSEGGGAVFGLYVAAGVWTARKLPLNRRILWLFPLALLAILLLGSTRTQHTIVPRGFLSGLAVMSVLAGQIFTLRPPGSRSSRTGAGAALAAALAIIVLGLLLGDPESISATPEGFTTPLFAGLILGLILALRDRHLLGPALAVLVISMGLFSAVANLVSTSIDLQRSILVSRFDIPRSHRQQIVSQPITTFFVSDQVLPMLAIQSNRDELAVSMNTALDLQTIRSDYWIGPVDEQMINQMELGAYSHVLIDDSEWDWLRTAPQDRPEWRGRYDATEEPATGSVLLILREDSDSG